MTSKHRMPPVRSRKVHWLVAMPVVGAIVVAGVVSLVGRWGSGGSITLSDATGDAPRAAGAVPVAPEVASPTSGPSRVAAAPSASGENLQERSPVPTTPRPRVTIPAPRSPLGGGDRPQTGDPGPPARIPSTSPTTSVKASPVTSAGPSRRSPVPNSALAALTPKSSRGASNGSFVNQVVALTNAERLDNGCSALTSDATLAAVAQDHSEDMAKRNFFDHNNPDGKSPFDRITAAGYTYSMAAENIAAGYRSPADVVKGWMNSSGHRANILNCGFTQIGVGYTTGGTHGTYWTQNFGTPLR